MLGGPLIKKKWKAITSADQIRRNMSFLQIYFNRIIPKVRGGPSYFDCYCGFERNVDTFLRDVEPAFSAHNCGMYHHYLQCPNIICIGWQQFSSKEMDCQVFQNWYSKALNLPIECRQRAITDGSKSLKERNNKQTKRVVAIHIYCNADYEQQVREAFYTWYSPQAMAFPLNTRMRIVLEIT